MRRPAPRSLLFLTIDAWRADYCDTYAGVTLTPNLARHARHTVRFDRVWSNGPWTTPGLLPMLTGEGPARHGVHWAWSEPRADTPALAKVFAAAGHEVPNLCYLSQVGNYFHLGWDAATAPAYPHDPDDPVLFDFLQEAAAGPRRRPFFGWYHYKFVHLPYWPAESHRAALGLTDADVPERLRTSVCSEFVLPRAQYPLEVGDTEIIRRLYAAGVHQADAFLGRVFDELERLGRWEDTTVVITSDHGEELMERGHAGHASTAEHALLNEELLRIPLIVVDSRVQAPARRPERVEGVDLFPTMLGLAGLQAPPSQGVDVSALVLAPERFQPSGGFATRPFLFHSARMGYRTPVELGEHVMLGTSDGQTKIVVERSEGERASLYDLERDPGEASPTSEGPEVEAAVARLGSAFEAAKLTPPG